MYNKEYTTTTSKETKMTQQEKDTLQAKLKSTPALLTRKPLKEYSVLVPIVELGGKKHFLFQLRSQYVRQAGEISFPGGERENEDADLEQTAVRECVEELGVARSKIEVLGHIGKVYPNLAVCIDSYLGYLKIDSLDELKPDTYEVEKLFVLPFEFFAQNPATIYHAQSLSRNYKLDKTGKRVIIFPSKELKLPEIYDEEWGHNDYKIYAYNTPYGLLWGLTSFILQEVIGVVDLQG